MPGVGVGSPGGPFGFVLPWEGTGDQPAPGNALWNNADPWINALPWDHSGGAVTVYLTAGSSLTVDATVRPVQYATADLISAGYILVAVATATRLAAAPLTSGSSLSATAVVPVTQQGAAALTSGSSLTATPAVFVQQGAAVLSSGSWLFAGPDTTTTATATPALVREHGSTGNKTSSATNLSVALDATTGVAAGNLLVAGITFDNTAAAAPVVNSIGKAGGETASWVRVAQHDSPQSAAAGGVRSELWAILTTVAWPAAGSYTVTLSAAVTAKGARAREFSGATATLRGTAGTGTSTASAPTATTGGTAPAAGDLVLGIGGFESSTAPTRDADTLNGAWDTGVTYGTAASTSATNVQGILQYKVVTAGGQQTFNPTIAGTVDAGAAVVALIPAVITVTTRDTGALLASASSLVAVGQRVFVTQAAAVLAAGSSLDVAGESYGPQQPFELSAEAGYGAPGALWVGAAWSPAAAGGPTVVEAAALLRSTSSLIAAGLLTQQTAAALTAASSLAAAATLTEFATVLLESDSFLDADADLVTFSTTTLAAGSSLTAAAVRQPEAAAVLASGSSLTAAATVLSGTTANLTAASSLTVAALRTAEAAAVLGSGSSLVAAPVSGGAASVNFTTASVLTVTAVRTAVAGSTLAAGSALSADAVRTVLAAAAFTTAASLTAAGERIRPGAAAFTTATVLTVTAARTAVAVAPLTAASSLVAVSLATLLAAANLQALSYLTAVAVAVPQTSPGVMTPVGAAVATFVPVGADTPGMTPVGAATATMTPA